MSHLVTTSFPHLRVRRITVDQNNISIDAFLTVHANDSEDNWLNEELFSDYVKIYFIIETGEYAAASDTRMASILASPESRIQNLMEVFVGDSTSVAPEQWSTIVAGNSGGTNIIKELTFSEALKNFYDSNITTSELDRNSGSLKDINFSVNIEDGFNLNVILNDDRTSGLRLYAFTHLDVAGLKSDFSLNDDPNSISEMLQLGGNLAVEDILIRDGETAAFDVPSTYQILTYEDGTPYSGIYHVHTADNPAPDGYVGYMEGPATMTTSARRLYPKSVPYKKVVANFILTDLVLENSFNGSEEMQEALDYSYVTPFVETKNMFTRLYGDTNLFSEGLQTFPGGALRGSTAAVSTMRDTNLQKIYNTEEIENLRKKHFDLLNERKDFQIIRDSYNYISYLDELDTNHTTVFRLDFEKLVRTKSKYAFLIDNLVKARVGSRGTDSEARVELYNILNLVKIKKLKVRRFRLSNEARSNNSVCTNDFDKFSNNQEYVDMISTGEGAANIIQSVDLFSDPEGQEAFFSISERSRTTGFNVREFTLKDYDLARNINYGNYAYDLEIHIEDGIKRILFELAQRLLENQVKFSEFLSAAQGGTSVPSAPEDKIDFEKNYVRGNIQYEKYYDHTTGRYSQSFLALYQQEYRQHVSRFIADFLTLQVMLGSASAESKSALSESIRAAVIPQNTASYESAELFAKVAERSISTLLKILQRDNISDTNNSSFDFSGNSFRTSASRSPQNAKSNVIVFNKRIPGSVRAFVEGDVFYSYGAASLENMLQRASQLAPDTTPGEMPGIFAESIDSHGQDIGVYRILEVDTYLELPESARRTVDTNIRIIETTLPSETINQADRDLTEPLPGPELPIPDISVLQPEITFPSTNIAAGVLGDVSLQSGLPAVDNEGILTAGNIPQVNIQEETAEIALVNYGSNPAIDSVIGDLQNELLAQTDVLALGDNIGNLAQNGAFGNTRAEVSVMVGGSGVANFQNLTTANLGLATSESSNDLVTIKIDTVSTGNGTATNNIFTMPAGNAEAFVMNANANTLPIASTGTGNSSGATMGSGVSRYGGFF